MSQQLATLHYANYGCLQVQFSIVVHAAVRGLRVVWRVSLKRPGHAELSSLVVVIKIEREDGVFFEFTLRGLHEDLTVDEASGMLHQLIVRQAQGRGRLPALYRVSVLEQQ